MKGKYIMKKTICNFEYDTEQAELLKQKTSGFFGEVTGYEERLYRTSGGKYFLYVSGGKDSPYPKENIKRMSEQKAKEWLSET